MTSTAVRQSSTATGHSSRLPLVCLLLIQLVVGYEWLNSGLTKIIRGGFPSGLAPDLSDRVKSAPGWYESFTKSAVLPHAVFFGYLIEIGEVLVGVGLIVGAALWIVRWGELPNCCRRITLSMIILSALGGIVMAVNFHIANGGSHPWLIPKSGFDESVDLDSLLPMIQLIFIALAVGTWRSLRPTGQKEA
jgi:uncharacterized membrane protein YphA (DoxX/SURF4 family)